MTSGVFVLQENGKLVPMSDGPYDTEDLLQTLLAKYPELLGRLLLVRREMGIPCDVNGSERWSIDHVFLDVDAVPTLVEVKRSSDTRLRREVVGQMLDYAANAVVYWPVEEMRSQFKHRCESCGMDADGEICRFVNDGITANEFWHRAKTNLQAGRIRMVFVADSIPPELKRIIEFLNEQMDPAEVLGVEIKQFVGEGMKTLVPSFVGRTAEAETRKGAGRAEKRQWDEQSFFDELAIQGAPQVRVARKLLEWAASRATRLWWGQGPKEGSVYPMFDDDRGQQYLFDLWTYGKIEIPFKSMKNPPFASADLRSEFVERLNRIEGISLPPEAINALPRIPMSSLVSDEVFGTFLSVIDWAFLQIRDSRANATSLSSLR